MDLVRQDIDEIDSIFVFASGQVGAKGPKEFLGDCVMKRLAECRDDNECPTD